MRIFQKFKILFSLSVEKQSLSHREETEIIIWVYSQTRFLINTGGRSPTLTTGSVHWGVRVGGSVVH